MTYFYSIKYQYIIKVCLKYTMHRTQDVNRWLKWQPLTDGRTHGIWMSIADSTYHYNTSSTGTAFGLQTQFSTCTQTCERMQRKIWEIHPHLFKIHQRVCQIIKESIFILSGHSAVLVAELDGDKQTCRRITSDNNFVSQYAPLLNKCTSFEEMLCLLW